MERDDIQDWIKKVEQASECAITETFFSKKANQNSKARGYAVVMETIDQLHDHDDAYVEAQELLTEWMNSKIRLELEYNESEDLQHHLNSSEEPTYSPPMSSVAPKYETFDDMYNYLDQEKESTIAQTFLQKLLQKKVAESGFFDDLGMDAESQQKKHQDPRLTMEARHKQVKENRLKRQAALESQKQKEIRKKIAYDKAQQLVQEEKRKKASQVKKEDGQIKKAMVQLRKEMLEKRLIMEEARRFERECMEAEKTRQMLFKGKTQHVLMEFQEQQNQARQAFVQRQKMQEVQTRINAHHLRSLQKPFSAWYKVVLEHRIKMGKARALFDWRSQFRAFQGWKTFVWTKKLEQETRRTEKELREENRKNQLAIKCNRKRILYYYFTDWRLWCKAERERRELEARKEETKQKMAALLDAASSGKLRADKVPDSSRSLKCANELQQTNFTQQKMEEVKKEDIFPVVDCKVRESSKTQHPIPTKLKYAWQVTRQHAALSSGDIAHFHTENKMSEEDQSSQQLNSDTARKRKFLQSNFQHRHNFQQQLIVEQRKQLQQQQDMILELQENQRVIMLQQEAKLASDITTARHENTTQSGNVLPEMRVPSARSPAPLCVEESNCARSTVIDCSKNNRHLVAPHPVVTAMEERARQRMARKKELEEIKQKKEEEKLAQLKAEEEERQRQQEAEKQTLLEKKRKEKRLQQQREVEKQLRLEREQQLQFSAEKHYQDFLLHKRGLEPWKKLVKMSKQKMKLAEEHHVAIILRLCLCSWHQIVRETLAKNILKAEKVYQEILLKRCFKNWIKCKDYVIIIEEKAKQHYLATLRRTYFIFWLDFVTEEKIASREKERIGVEHNQRRIVKTAFRAWKRLPMLIKEEEKKQVIRQQLRKKVSEILPDFHTE
uniref:Coiled-coil domain containing 191 n=2 Tax=Callorhinchus milii TaxID=7868 RepID=A0A4W3I4Y6_CALMI